MLTRLETDYSAECGVFEGLFWILDKRAHTVNLRSISFPEDAVNTAVVTLTNGAVIQIDYRDNLNLIHGIVLAMEALDHAHK